MGGNLDDIAKVLERTVEAYDKARREVESLEELTQVTWDASSGPNITDNALALEGDSDQS